MVEIVFLAPFITGIFAFFLPKSVGRPLLVGTGALHLSTIASSMEKQTGSIF